MSSSTRPKTKRKNKSSHSSLPSQVQRRLSALPPNRKVLDEVLTQSLAAYILLRSTEPISEVIGDLFDIEIKAASIIESVYADKEKALNLRGSLASVFSFVPVGRQRFLKDVTPKEPQALPRRASTRKKKTICP